MNNEILEDKIELIKNNTFKFYPITHGFNSYLKSNV